MSVWPPGQAGSASPARWPDFHEIDDRTDDAYTRAKAPVGRRAPDGTRPWPAESDPFARRGHRHDHAFRLPCTELLHGVTCRDGLSRESSSKII